ncbi:MAG: hypothetical protein K0Q89_19 [Thermomicrobiales bacterium]|jgi:hypothetical protein|nr:hypothetical protein [Thermomicrobiales bacterium]
MATYYMRSKKTDEIINAVEGCRSPQEAEEIFDGTVYADAHPPLEVLQRYRYWNERP